MFRNGQSRIPEPQSVERRLHAVRSYLQSIHSACLHPITPRTGYVLLVDESQRCRFLAPGGYTLVARVGEWALLCPIALSPRGELEYSDRLVTVPFGLLSDDMVVGRETLILPD